MKKIVSVLLVLTMICVCTFSTTLSVGAEAQNRDNIVSWADYYYDITWTALKTIPGWHGSSSYTLYKGTTYHIPYAQPIERGAYIGYGVSVDDFLAAANNADSVFYSNTSAYGSTYSCYYGMDCSAFVSSCWGISRHTTYSIPNVSENLGAANESNIDKLALGDALNSRSVGHVVLVTGIEYADGKVSKVEITEQTPPQLRRVEYTRSALISKYSAYNIQRYNGSVPSPPVETVKYILGDVDSDSDVNIIDAAWIQRRLAGITLTVSFDDKAADADHDGDVTISDVTWIQRYIADIDIDYPIGTLIE